jgi:Ca2+/Na+ antiporter
MAFFTLLIVIIIGTYAVIKFKKLPNDSEVNKYHNSRYYLLILAIIMAIFSLIMILFTDQNK